MYLHMSLSVHGKGAVGEFITVDCYFNVIVRMKLICCECPAFKPFSVSLEECLFKLIFFLVPHVYILLLHWEHIFVYLFNNICLRIPRQSYLAATMELNNCLNLSEAGLKTHRIQNSQILSSFKYFLVLANAARLRKAVSPM